MSLAACATPVVAPGYSGGLRGPLGSVQKHGACLCTTRGSENECLPNNKICTTHFDVDGCSAFPLTMTFSIAITNFFIRRNNRLTPWLRSMSWSHKNHRHEQFCSIQQASAQHSCCISYAARAKFHCERTRAYLNRRDACTEVSNMLEHARNETSRTLTVKMVPFVVYRHACMCMHGAPDVSYACVAQYLVWR